MTRIRITLMLACALVLLPYTASASMQFSIIGDPGNAADTRIMSDLTTGYGSVGYSYAISRYAVTNAEWEMFRSSHTSPYSGADKPVQNVSWFEAAQYCNWLTSGDITKGAYLFDQSGNFLGIDRESAIEKVTDGVWGRVYVLPTEDEWHKAAFYDGQDYWLYSNGTNTPSVAGVEAMYNQEWPYDGPWDVDEGTPWKGLYNMMGNVWEWTETSVGSYKVLRGGAYDTLGSYCLSSTYRHYIGVPYGGYDNVGFRIVAIVPEPASLLLFAAGGLTLVRKKRFS